MRVTRLIREYVEKKVREAYPKTIEELAWEEHDKSLDEAVAEANEKIFEFAEKLAEELNIKYGFPADNNLRAVHHGSIARRYNNNSEIYQAYFKAKDERYKKINEQIEEILLTLELGGSKADLDKMLANIGK
jgi:hypothetical protein